MMKFLTHRLVVLISAALSPLLYLVAQNQFIYTRTQIFFSLVHVTVFCIVGYEGGLFFRKFIFESGKLLPTAVSVCKIKIQVYLFLIAVIALSGLIFYFGVLFINNNAHQNTSAGNALLFTLILFVFGIGYSSILSRAFGVFIFAFAAISLARLIFGMSGESIWPEFKTSNLSEIQMSNKNIVFKKKPNIYLFLLESFHSSSILTKVYGVNCDEFINELNGQGYTIYNSEHSNYTNTLFSAASLFQMDHSFYSGARGNSDAVLGIRQSISGVSYNPVLDVLKRNGYSIAYIQSSDYMYRLKNKNIDYTNLKFSKFLILRPVIDIGQLLGPSLKTLFRRNQSMRKKIREKVLQPHTKDLVFADKPVIYMDSAKVRDLMSYINFSAGEKPVFRFIYWLGANHTSTLMDNIKDENKKREFASKWKDYYANLIAKSELEIIDVIHQINRQDPSALIIMIGDHGAWLNGIFVRKNIDYNTSAIELKKAASHYGLTLGDIAEDVTSVLCAIKWPKDVSVHGKKIESHVNLFRYVFSVLAEDTSIINNAKQDASYILLGSALKESAVYKISQDGAPLQDWVKINQIKK